MYYYEAMSKIDNNTYRNVEYLVEIKQYYILRLNRNKQAIQNI